MLKLGSIVTDRATGIKGTLTVRETDMDGLRMLYIEPKSINKETGAPVDGIWVGEARADGKEHADVAIPVEVLGTIVTDTINGFSGMAIAIVEHLSGCIHVVIQPEGQTKEGKAIKSHNFDIRRLEGKAIKKLAEAQKQQSRRETPSPEGAPHYTR